MSFQLLKSNRLLVEQLDKLREVGLELPDYPDKFITGARNKWLKDHVSSKVSLYYVKASINRLDHQLKSAKGILSFTSTNCILVNSSQDQLSVALPSFLCIHSDNNKIILHSARCAETILLVLDK